MALSVFLSCPPQSPCVCVCVRCLYVYACVCTCDLSLPVTYRARSLSLRLLSPSPSSFSFSPAHTLTPILPGTHVYIRSCIHTHTHIYIYILIAGNPPAGGDFQTRVRGIWVGGPSPTQIQRTQVLEIPHIAAAWPGTAHEILASRPYTHTHTHSCGLERGWPGTAYEMLACRFCKVRREQSK